MNDQTRDGVIRHSASARRGMAVLVAAVGVLLALVIATPIVLSSQDLVMWAKSPTGLGLGAGWAVLVFVALDAAAAACVGMVVYCAWRGESAGTYGWLVWVFAGASAFANYRFNEGSAARDAVWFFPAMSIAGPFLLEVTVRRVRRWVQLSAGRYENPLPHFRLARWIPGVGAMRETYGSWRTAVLDGGISTPDAAVARFRQLCPNGKPRVVRAMRQEALRPAETKIKALVADEVQAPPTELPAGAPTQPAHALGRAHVAPSSVGTDLVPAGELAELLAEQTTELPLVTPGDAMNGARKQRRRADETRRLVQAMANGGLEAPEIATLLDITDRYVRQLLAEVPARINGHRVLDGSA